MFGVWLFKDGVARLVPNPMTEPIDRVEISYSKRKVLVYLPTGEIITSYACLDQKLLGLGWERYPNEDLELLQFHKSSSVHLISLPKDFSKFKSMHMYDIVYKNRLCFEVRGGGFPEGSYLVLSRLIRLIKRAPRVGILNFWGF